MTGNLLLIAVRDPLIYIDYMVWFFLPWVEEGGLTLNPFGVGQGLQMVRFYEKLIYVVERTYELIVMYNCTAHTIHLTYIYLHLP